MTSVNTDVAMQDLTLMGVRGPVGAGFKPVPRMTGLVGAIHESPICSG